MITLLIGKKGSGKTKRLVENANAAVENTNGSVVVVEAHGNLTLEISHKARLVSLEPYDVSGADALYGFISGICAGNYDVKEIFVDSLIRIIGLDTKDLSAFIEKVQKLAEFAETRMTFSVSMAREELPADVLAYAQDV